MIYVYPCQYAAENATTLEDLHKKIHTYSYQKHLYRFWHARVVTRLRHHNVFILNLSKQEYYQCILYRSNWNTNLTYDFVTVCNERWLLTHRCNDSLCVPMQYNAIQFNAIQHETVKRMLISTGLLGVKFFLCSRSLLPSCMQNWIERLGAREVSIFLPCVKRIRKMKHNPCYSLSFLPAIFPKPENIHETY